MNLSVPVLVRVLPFAAFMGLLALRGALSEWPTLDARWIYSLNGVVVGGLLWAFWRHYTELHRAQWPNRREVSMSVALGLMVFVLWIHLDAPWMVLGTPTATFVPLDAQGQLIWPLVLVRALGATLLVPLMEELFWRSFLMRWLSHPEFEAMPPQRAGARALVLSTFAFMLVHTQWLAAIVAGLVYAGLYLRTGRLWTAVIAHAVTNGALALWVIHTQQWQFW